MLSSAALDVADRLIIAVMTFLDAAADSAAAGNTPTLSQFAAQNLFVRLARLATRLILIANLGVRAPPQRNPAPPTQTAPEPLFPSSRPAISSVTGLPRHPGWLLTALPELAPAIAADIAALLADPALATLLDRAPSLHRLLDPLLRSLGLAAPPPNPTPSPSPTPPPPSAGTTPQPAAPPNPTPPPPHQPPIPTTPPNPAHRSRSQTHARFVTFS